MMLTKEELQDLKRLIECLLFVSSEPLKQDRIKDICHVSPEDLESVIKELTLEYADRGFSLRKVAGGWQFFTAPELSWAIEQLYKPKMQQLSRAGLETLAIIAYKQPVTKQDIENIRQVNADSVVSTLMEKQLIKEVGRRNVPGRPILYGTTEEFLTFFGLDSLDDLPALETFLEEDDSIKTG